MILIAMPVQHHDSAQTGILSHSCAYSTTPLHVVSELIQDLQSGREQCLG